MGLTKILAATTLSLLLAACGSSDDDSDSGLSDTQDQTDEMNQTDGTDQSNSTDNTDGTNTTDGTDTTVGDNQTDGAGNDDGIARFGFINMEQEGDSDDDIIETSVNGTFYSIEPGFRFDIDEEFNIVADTCTIDEEDIEDTDFPEFEDNATTFNAGETIIISSNAGTFATVNRLNQAGLTIYASLSELPVPPQGLVIDIPGGDFPAFNNLTFPSLTIPTIAPSNAEDINANTTFQWDGSNEPYGLLTFDITVRNGPSIFCSARDDGSFSFPDRVRSAIGESTVARIDFQRNATQIATSGDAFLVLIHDWESN